VRTTIAMFLLAIFGGMILWVAQGSGADQYERGKNLFLEKCQLCHGASGEGDGPAAVAYNPRPANFTDPNFWKDNPEKKIAEAVRNGYKIMPPVALKADEISAIIEYMEHTFKK
jgi:mono/diheme cytochrome c family protein